MTAYEALCWGGPLEGKTIAAPHREFNAARHKPIRYWLHDEDVNPENAVTFWQDTYRYEIARYGPLDFGAWIVTSPTERSEALRETILGGLRLVAWLTSL